MKLTAQFPRVGAWLTFLGGLEVTLLFDRWMRSRDGQIQDGGLPEIIYCGVPIVVGLLALSAIWRAMKRYENRRRGILEMAGHLTAGFVVHTLLIIHYVLGSGIDSL